MKLGDVSQTIICIDPVNVEICDDVVILLESIVHRRPVILYDQFGDARPVAFPCVYLWY